MSCKAGKHWLGALLVSKQVLKILHLGVGADLAVLERFSRQSYLCENAGFGEASEVVRFIKFS
jgi:hypothetical protein